ncbi:hypothetical protein AV530_001180 [Patagioenas fasciata monilis]|uniref:Uncharacterized protein n=1 Tax=Patagioenas fasciata monilis TaxID=372326 RepID=A0A1V4KTS4_PATFA|nr:hypothetical protein AV530_001180 [Patagioenas fasciata monilis]
MRALLKVTGPLESAYHRERGTKLNLSSSLGRLTGYLGVYRQFPILPGSSNLTASKVEVNQTQATEQIEMLAAQCCEAQPFSAAGTAEGPAVTPAGWKKLESQWQDCSVLSSTSLLTPDCLR